MIEFVESISEILTAAWQFLSQIIDAFILFGNMLITSTTFTAFLAGMMPGIIGASILLTVTIFGAKILMGGK